MKRAIFYRGFIIKNYHKKEQGYLVITPAQVEILLLDAVNFEQCKWWIDRNLVKFAIDKAFN
jgi:hypothetical protein